MALGSQASPTQALVTFCLWAQRNGYAVGEMHGFSSVHRVHTLGSWHYDQDGPYGKAADLNKNGPNERADLIRALDVARSLGLGVIFARDGARGVAASHQTHLHVDVSAYTHLGKGASKAPGGGDRVTENLQRAVRATADQAWGPDTEQRLNAVRAASAMHRGQHPYGVAFTQAVVGAKPDSRWGPRSAAAHDATVSSIQRALGVADDGKWGPRTEASYLAHRDIRWRR